MKYTISQAGIDNLIIHRGSGMMKCEAVVCNTGGGNCICVHLMFIIRQSQ